MKKIAILLLSLGVSLSSFADQPVSSDARIKTYIYNPSEVFKLVMNSGYQSSIEFAEGEEIETISLGDLFAWKVNPVENRVFVKPMEDDIHTNMTIITNKRTYYFDLFSKEPDGDMDPELVYVMRFFYPEKNQ